MSWIVSLLSALTVQTTEPPPHLELGDWIYLGEIQGSHQFARPHPRQPMFWWRIEGNAGSRFQSSYVAQMEVDCPSDRVRKVGETLYSEPNLGGDVTRTGGTEDWTYPHPESMIGTVADIICERQAKQ